MPYKIKLKFIVRRLQGENLGEWKLFHWTMICVKYIVLNIIMCTREWLVYQKRSKLL